MLWHVSSPQTGGPSPHSPVGTQGISLKKLKKKESAMRYSRSRHSLFGIATDKSTHGKPESGKIPLISIYIPFRTCPSKF